MQIASKNTFNAVDITGADYGKDFQLTDHHGKLRGLADFKGKAVLLFFGFTHCPDICPTTLSDVTKTLKLLGDDGKRVQLLFITLDPERDTQQVLAQYVPAFDPSFLGLYGSADQIQAVAKNFRIFYQKTTDTKDSASYSMDHMAGLLAFDPQGQLRLFINNGVPAEKMAEDLRKLLR